MLRAATPGRWLTNACERLPELLSDHANCEKKAASTALALMFAYPEDRALCLAMSRLAREELRHFEQVERMMGRLGVKPLRLSPGRYAGGLRSKLATHEPQRKIDLLLCGALIEARSCERFESLAAVLEEPLAAFYAGLAESERRHGQLYVDLAQSAARLCNWGDVAQVQHRLQELAEVEADLVSSPDPQFRFHSGPDQAHAA